VTLSPAAYKGKVGLAILCPITRQVKGYPFEVLIPEGLEMSGAILSDQVKSLDWRVR
jgi:mRNA interferase MazF